MNKLLGFYELKNSLLPTVPWNEYDENTVLNSELLWTVRSAVYSGNDLNLPRLVGVTADEAMQFAQKTLNQLRGNGIVLYYPYFLADKSGTLNVYSDKIVIEAVQDVFGTWSLILREKLQLYVEAVS